MTVFEATAGKPGAEHVFRPLHDETESGTTPVKFPRTARLLKHADFRRVYEQGRRHFSANLTAFYLAHPDAVGPRIGFTVSRALGGAVPNRLKRRLREATREAWNGFSPAVDVVVNPKKTLLKAEFAGVIEEMRKALAVVAKQVALGQANPQLTKPRTGSAGNPNPRPAENVTEDRRSKGRTRKGQP